MRRCATWLGTIAWATLLSGCSLLFDLDRFDKGGARADASLSDAPGGGSDGPRPEDSGGGDDATQGDAGGGPIDSGNDAPLVCNQEQEINDDSSVANTLKPGPNCGTITDSDDDYWRFQYTGTGKLTLKGTFNQVRFSITGPGTNTSDVGQGPHTQPVGTGQWEVIVDANDGVSTGAYTITLE